MRTVICPSRRPNAAAARSSWTSETRWSSRKWLPEPSVPIWPAPRSRARGDTAAASAPGRQPPDSVKWSSSSDPMPRSSTSARGPSRSTRSSEAPRSAVAGPFAAGADRYAPRELVHQRLAAATELVEGDGQRQQPHAAVDVVADPAGRNHAVSDGGGGHSHRESVALVDVRHGQRRIDDAGQRGHVGQLLSE